jgi:hypothetical protein
LLLLALAREKAFEKLGRVPDLFDPDPKLMTFACGQLFNITPLLERIFDAAAEYFVANFPMGMLPSFRAPLCLCSIHSSTSIKRARQRSESTAFLTPLSALARFAADSFSIALPLRCGTISRAAWLIFSLKKTSISRAGASSLVSHCEPGARIGAIGRSKIASS